MVEAGQVVIVFLAVKFNLDSLGINVRIIEDKLVFPCLVQHYGKWPQRVPPLHRAECDCGEGHPLRGQLKGLDLERERRGRQLEEGQRAVVSGKAKEQQDEAGPQGSLGAVPGT